MNTVRTSIYTTLAEDAALFALAPGGVHYGVAEEGTEFPYIVFHKQTGTPRRTFGGKDGDREMYLIKAVAQDTENSSGQELAEEIDTRIKLLLTDSDFEYLRHELDVEFQEQRVNGTVYNVGAIWRVETNV